MRAKAPRKPAGVVPILYSSECSGAGDIASRAFKGAKRSEAKDESASRCQVGQLREVFAIALRRASEAPNMVQVYPQPAQLAPARFKALLAELPLSPSSPPRRLRRNIFSPLSSQFLLPNNTLVVYLTRSGSVLSSSLSSDTR